MNPYQSVIKNMTVPGDSQRARPIPTPGDLPGITASGYHTEIYTYFTVPDGESKLIYSAESWVVVRLMLTTAGPVDVGTRENVSPVLSGRGITLTTNEELKFTLPKGDRLFIVASAVNRVSFIIEPIPWLQTMTQNIQAIGNQISGTVAASSRGIMKAVGAALAPRKPSKPEEICPPKLTPPFRY